MSTIRTKLPFPKRQFGPELNAPGAITRILTALGAITRILTPTGAITRILTAPGAITRKLTSDSHSVASFKRDMGIFNIAKSIRDKIEH